MFYQYQLSFAFHHFADKVHFTLYEAMKAQSGSKGIDLLFFNLGARLGYVVNSTKRPLYPLEKDSITIVQEAE